MTQDTFSEILAIGTGPELNINDKETFIDAFLRQVEKIPDATAVVDETGSITYGELNRRSDNFASVLIEKGIHAGDFVAITLPRVKEFLVAVIGVWKAGAAYIPIDPTYPKKRIAYMLEDSEAKEVIDETWLESLCEVPRGERTESICRAEAKGTAILIYTSGSTGVPKGVVISHTAVLCMCIAGQEFHQSWAKEGYKTAEVISFSYIYSCHNIYRSLTVGGEVHLLPTRMVTNPEELDRYIRDNAINLMNTVPQMAVTLMNTYHTPLDIIGTGGSKMVKLDRGMTRVLTGYALTETGSGGTHMLVSDKDNGKAVVGIPYKGTIIVLEGEDGTPVPLGEVGEICISSPGVASGYLHDEERTREVFVERPWSRYKVVRTGDLGRWNEDKMLELHGRKNDRVKIRGNRVELGEVDAALARIEGIRAAASALKEVNGEPLLCGYYVSEHAISEVLLRSSLLEFLPSYMIPSLFVRLEVIPRLPNGKLDRLSLPKPELRRHKETVAPATEFEKRVFELVSAELGSNDFGVTTNLLSLGLTSLRAIRLSGSIQKRLDCCISQAAMLEHPTIREWEKISTVDAEAITVEAPRKHYPLADNQKELIMMEMYNERESDRQTDPYDIPILLKINGGDADRLCDAVRKAIENHPVLKTHLEKCDGEIVQIRRDEAEMSVGFEKLVFEPNEDFFKKRFHPFHLFGEDLARFTVYSSPKAVWLFFDIHHIIFDGSSVNLFIKTLSALYQGISPEAESVTAYDNVLYREHWKESDAYRESERYFEALLEGTESFRYPSVSGQEMDGRLAKEKLILPRATVRSFCRECGITENSFFAMVLTQVFHRVSREESIQIAMLSSGRSMTQLSETVGMFVQTLPLVSRLTDATVFDALNSIHSQVIATLSRDKYPYVVLAEKYGVKPNVVYVYQGDLIEKPNFGAVSVEWNCLPVSCAIFPLSIEIIPENERYVIRFEYKSGLYGAEEIKILSRAVANMARGMAESKVGTLLRDIEMVEPHEHEELLKLGAGERFEAAPSETFIDLFLQNVSHYPDATAVVDCNGSLKYRELDAASDAIAHTLIDKGVRLNEFVAVMLPRRKEFLASIIGIWKAGAAYVPIDPSYPKERIAYMLEDCEAKVVIDETFCNSIATEKCDPVNLATPEGVAYMIYTSGTTGKPKGVVIQHLALTNFINFIRNEWHLEASSRISCHSNYAFDASVEDLYPVLTAGGTLFLPSEETCLDLEALVCYLKNNKITGGCYTTQIGELLAASYPELPLDYLVLGGEKMTLCPTCSYRLINSYGPTEATVDCAYQVIDPQNDYTNIPIGRPLNNLYAFVCDQEAHLVPRGMVGELCIAGPQLAKGYWHQPELTAETFVDCPYLPGQRMFKTGDLARWNDDGQLEYLGRIDNQVKIRGFRVELGEVESIAMQVEGLRQAVAAVKNECIVLYWCGEVSEAELRSYLNRHLPEYMLPSIYIHLEALPLTPSGKIDRKHLPEPGRPQDEHVAPATEKEQLLFDRVKELLGIEELGVTDDLTGLGMNSLQAMKLALGLPAEWGIKVSDIIGSRTIREMVTEKHNVLWFHEPYDSAKKTIAMVHGVIGGMGLKEWKDELSKSFNVIEIEPIYDTIYSCTEIDALVSPDGYDEFIRLYVRRLRELLPEGGVLSLVLGFSFGGKMAYDTACEWKNLTGQEPVVVMGDSYLKLSTEAEDDTVPAATYEKWRAAIRAAKDNAELKGKIDFWNDLCLDIRRNKKSVQNYSGRVIFLRALRGYKINIDIAIRLRGGIWYNIARWIYQHLHIKELFTTKVSDIGIFEAGYRLKTRKNLSVWKQFKPNLEIIDVKSTHDGIFSDREQMVRYTKLIRSYL